MVMYKYVIYFHRFRNVVKIKGQPFQFMETRNLGSSGALGPRTWVLKDPQKCVPKVPRW